MKNTRDKIITAAYACFMEKGYEQTSVRMILDKARVTIGSFYHFFTSKEELFEAVIDAFLTDYVSVFESICLNHALPVTQRCELLLDELKKRMREYYGQLGGEHLHWSIAYSLHEKTIRSILPSVETLLTDAICADVVTSRMKIDTRTLSLLLVRGVETILHSKGHPYMAEGERTEYLFSKCKEYMKLLLEISGSQAAPGSHLD